jgi:hypothetical protein
MAEVYPPELFDPEYRKFVSVVWMDGPEEDAWCAWRGSWRSGEG